jgi:LmbE family N-acetylglucosaminyl deacetylase
MAAKKTILYVLAHPDDESFGWGGSIAYYSTQGVDVHLVCATRGEAGTVEPEFLKKHKTIAKLREAELMCAADALGLKSVTFLGYRDSGMAGSKDNENAKALVRAPQAKVAAAIAKHIRRLKPQVVITFDHVGGYHHPDHIAIHKATVEAFHLVRKSAKKGAYRPDKLFFNSINRGRLRRIVFMMRLTFKDPTKLGRNKDIDLTYLTKDKDTPRHVTLNYRHVQHMKDKADACHASQQGGRFARFSLAEFFNMLLGRTDSYTRAYPITPDDYRAKDLFAG